MINGDGNARQVTVCLRQSGYHRIRRGHTVLTIGSAVDAVQPLSIT